MIRGLPNHRDFRPDHPAGGFDFGGRGRGEKPPPASTLVRTQLSANSLSIIASVAA